MLKHQERIQTKRAKNLNKGSGLDTFLPFEKEGLDKYSFLSFIFLKFQGGDATNTNQVLGLFRGLLSAFVGVTIILLGPQCGGLCF